MKKNTLIFLALVIVLIGCKKNQLGGNSSIKGQVAHHEKAIANALVYIKFNSKESAGTDISKYDASVQADAQGNYEFPSLYKGDYYLYAVGQDLAVPAPYIVSGGVPAKLGYKKKLIMNVPVVE